MKKRTKLCTAALAGVLGASLTVTSAFAFDGFTTYKGSNMVEYYGDYDSVNYPFKELDAKFTTKSVLVDGEMDEAYIDAMVSEIANAKKADGYGLEPAEETRGELRSVWNGPDLYLLVSVYDDCVCTTDNAKPGATTNPAVAGETEISYPYKGWGGFWDTWAVETTKETSDSIALAVDLYNDRTTYELDTAGVVTIDPKGNLYYYSSSNIPSLGSALGDPTHPEYMDIIKGYAAAPMFNEGGKQIGYNVEICLSVEGVEPGNGTQLGVDVKINDVNNIVTSYTDKQIENPNYVAPEPEPVIAEVQDEAPEIEEAPVSEETSEAEEIPELEETPEAEEAPEVEESPSDVDDTEVNTTDEYITIKEAVYEIKKSSNIFWSHNQDSLYSDFNHEHTNSTDWGVVTLTGWNGTDEFAYSDWTIQKILRYIDSASFAKGVYTAESQKRLDDAVNAAKVIISSTEQNKAVTDNATKELKEAFDGLRWADTKYPDPADLKKQVTLPNTYQFFNSSKVVTNKTEWEARREEILDLAQFYEYGYKPEYDSLEIIEASAYKEGDKYMRESMSNPGTMKEDVRKESGAAFKARVTVGDASKDFDISVAFPSQAKLAASGHADEKLPIVLSFDGAISSYTDAGLALITVPSVVSDTRTNDYAWGNRTGAFYELYPYERNGEGALKEVSNEMAEAWAASLVIDILQACASSEDENLKSAVAMLDTEKYAVTGFSINGKYAFVAGVFDDRIDVVIPGAAGATGPSPWRYVYRGQEYDWTDTAYTNPSVESYQVAWGTEVIANSVRHNRVRETEMFRKFMTPGHFYAFEEDAYGYATRLPYDQNDLVATLAPRAIIIENTVNDYNDGCTADCLGAEIAKAVYNTLGYDADNLVKFNLRNLKTGDPHGNDSEQRNRSAQYLNYYFFGTEMDEAVETYLSTDPFSLNISNNKSANPYDYYWGGFNTITGGTNGKDGRDGWYYYKFPTVPSGNNDSDDGNTEDSHESSTVTETVVKEPVAIAPVVETPTVSNVPQRRTVATDIATQETVTAVESTDEKEAAVVEEKAEEKDILSTDAPKTEKVEIEINTESIATENSDFLEQVSDTVTKLVEAITSGTADSKAVSEETLGKIKTALEEGKSITAEVTVKVVDETVIPAADKKKIDEVIADEKKSGVEVACYLDLSIMLKTTDGDELGTYNELTGKVTFTIPTPEGVTCPEGKEYVVIRIHNGESTIIPATVNSDGTLSFETDKLSSYALAIRDIEKASSPMLGIIVAVVLLAVLTGGFLLFRRNKETE